METDRKYNEFEDDYTLARVGDEANVKASGPRRRGGGWRVSDRTKKRGVPEGVLLR